MTDGSYRFTVRAGRVGLRALGVTTRVQGAQRLPRSGPVLMAANHVGYPDFVFVARGALEQDRYVRFMCRHDIWHVPGVRLAMSTMRHIPVDRAAPAGAYLRARALLADGQAVCSFPEAGISHSYTVRALMPGVASLARETGLPIIPVTVWGSQRIWSVGRAAVDRKPGPSLARGRLVDVRFGEPLFVGPADDLVSVTQQLGHELTNSLEELQRLPEHRPRPGERAPWYPAHLGGHAPDRVAARALDSVPQSAVPPTWGPATTLDP